MDRAIVSVGMGSGQYEFIKKAKAKGFKVIAFGKGKNSPDAVALTDYSNELDTTDVEGAIKWIDSLPVEIAGVGSMAGGRAIETVQKLANYYSVAGRVPEELIIGNDKVEQMKLYSKYGLSSIQTWRVDELPDNLDKQERYIIKPAKGRGSEGIRIVSLDELMEIKAKGSLEADDIVQTIVAGEEYRCLLMIQNGDIIFTAPVHRESYADTVFLGRLKYDDSHLAALEAHFRPFIEKSGLENGVIKADVLIDKDRLNVIEMDIGVGGGIYYQTFISDIYERDIVSDYIDIITNVTVRPYGKPSRCLAMDYVFNRYDYPVSYDLQACEKELSKYYKLERIQINALHPENKAGFASNADFIMAVIYEYNENCKKEEIDRIINENVFIKKDR